MNPIKIKKICLSGAVGLFLGAISFPCQAEDPILPKSITITGYAEKIIRSNRATFEKTFTAEDRDFDTAYQNIQKQISALKKLMMDMGIKNVEIHLQAPVTSIEVGGRAQEKKHGLSIKSVIMINDVELEREIQEKMYDLVQRGAVEGPRLGYQYTKVSDLQKELTKQALVDGEKRARDYAQALGLSIKKIPLLIKPSDISCDPIFTENPPKVYWTVRYSDYPINKFSVLVEMQYSLDNPSKKVDEQNGSAVES